MQTFSPHHLTITKSLSLSPRRPHWSLYIIILVLKSNFLMIATFATKKELAKKIPSKHPLLLHNRKIQLFSLFLPLGSKVTGLDTIESLDRFQEPPLSGPFCDLIWSDPLLEEILGKRLSDKEYQEVREGLSLKHSFLYLCSHTSICYYGNSHNFLLFSQKQYLLN